MAVVPEHVVSASMYGWTDREIERAWLSRSFRAFAQEAWRVAMPGVQLQWASYLDGLCLHLQAMTESWERIFDQDTIPPLVPLETPFRNLLINVPPRMLKSTICSVLWPVWMWTRTPSVRILSSSYGSHLAERDAVESRRVILSPWYQERWGDSVRLQPDQNRKDRYDNTAGGYRIAIGKGGGITGLGGDILLSDDPESAADMFSAAARRHTKEWFGNIWSNRMNDPNRSCMVVIQQRIHADDLSGTLLEQGDWQHLSLPMQYEGDDSETIIGWRDPRTEDGEYLTPDRFGDTERQAVIRRAGELGYATQFQQRAVQRTGAILKEDRWTRYRRGDLPERFRKVAVFADTASKKSQRNDYTAMALWGEDERGWWLLDLVWRRMEFPELVEAGKAAWARWRSLPQGRRPTRFVVEDASSGTALIQSFKAATNIPVIEYSATGQGDMDERVNAIAGYQFSGRLHVPATDSDGLGGFDVESFIAEHTMYPNAAHDDRVQTTCMMMMYWEIAPEKHGGGGVVVTGSGKRRLA